MSPRTTLNFVLPLVALPLSVVPLVAACAAHAAREAARPPEVSGLESDERVDLYPTAAALAPDGRFWRVPIHVCVFEPEQHDPLRTAALAPLRELVELGDDRDAARLFEQRARLFLVDHERRETVRVAVAGSLWPIGPTAPNGHATATLDVPAAAARASARDGRWLDVEVGAPDEPCHRIATVELVGDEGLSVVSDIDDTVKRTDVRDRRAALRATFLREFAAVPGMAELLARLAARGATLHWVSLSPWQLAAPLLDFLERTGFPRGSLALQHFRLQDGDFADLVGDSKAKKLAAIEPLLATWPRRRFVLIGDDGQSDPEVYAELARLHPRQIAAIWIRLATAVDDEAPAPAPAAAPRPPLDDARWRAAFAGTDRAIWTLFTDPAVVTLPE